MQLFKGHVALVSIFRCVFRMITTGLKLFSVNFLARPLKLFIVHTKM
jgi:hypothetical protein